MENYSASAKIIVFGEHSVVYGKPAIAVPVSSLRAYVSVTPSEGGLRLQALDVFDSLETETVQAALTLTARLVLEQIHVPEPDVTLSIRSQIPVASGLGSGAAVATALARALLATVRHPLPTHDLNRIVYEVEKLHHGTPSGIDNTVIVYESPVYFVRGQAIETLAITRPFMLLIADTGISASTKIAVGDVRKLYDSNPAQYGAVFEKIGNIVREAKTAIESGSVEILGRLMNANHELLQTLTVSAPELDRLVQVAVSSGAEGAKLSGGGRGGNLIALVTPQTAEQVRYALLQAGANRVFQTEVGGV